MNVLFRVDGSIEIGTGHVIRCLALAEGLKSINADIFFICRDLKGNLCEYIENKGYTLFRLSMPKSTIDQNRLTNYSEWFNVLWHEDAKETINIILKNKIHIDWLIIDHYSIDIRWERQLHQYVKNIMVIDDITNRKHYCNVILNQNHLQDLNIYKGLIPISCNQLLGFKYALLRPEFKYAKSRLKERDGKIDRILVYFGGTDLTNETEKALKAISLFNNLFKVYVIVGINNSRKKNIEQLCEKSSNHIYHYQINNMEEIMSSVDLAICAGGSTTLERYCLGLPAITIAVADNQISIAKNGAILGIDYYLGIFKEVNAEMIFSCLKEINDSPDRIKKSSLNAYKLVDGYGVERVISFLEEKK